MKSKKIAASAWLVSTMAGFLAGNAWAVLPIEHWQQASGAKVYFVHSPSIPMVDVHVSFDAGARREPATKVGLASALALMTDKGVQADGQQQALDENALGEAWADLGASFDAQAGKDSLSYTLRSLTVPELLQRSTQLAARQIALPALPEPVWLRERARWSASIAEANTRPSTVAARAFGDAVYSGHPYGWRSTAQTLAAIEMSDARAFHRSYLQACRAKVSVVGALTKPEVDTLVAQLLSKLPRDDGKGCQPLPSIQEVPALAQARTVNIPFRSAQAQVLIGQPGIQRNDPDFLALLVGDHILGGGGLVSRLMEEVREKRGLTYGVSSSFSPGLHAGAFTISLQTRPDQAQLARQVAHDTLTQFVREGPTEQELRDAKDNLIGSFALRIDSNRKLLANVANIAWNDLPLDYLDHWTEKVEALTLDDVRGAMQRAIQPDRMVTVVLGEKK